MTTPRKLGISKRVVWEVVSDAMIVGGCGAIVWAIAELMGPPFAYGAAGIMLIFFGVVVGLGRAQ